MGVFHPGKKSCPSGEGHCIRNQIPHMSLIEWTCILNFIFCYFACICVCAYSCTCGCMRLPKVSLDHHSCGARNLDFRDRVSYWGLKYTSLARLSDQ